ncbi:hypothetical protein [Compostibacter hankyongensis]|uniref:Outer membrane protein transport protein n=1 Tax=Compostibacter hankyongensis TaxID=1007089 RepID=A0ABP8G4T7_9BACT
MKRSLLSAVLVFLSIVAAQAQDETDALRYSRLTSGGDARTQAIGGAMGSLGGDVSAMSVNPAGIGLFKTNELTITPGFRSLNTDATYYDNQASDSKSSLFLQQIGLIFASNPRRKNNDSRWKNVTFGLGVNRLANFNRSLYYTGTIKGDKSNFSSYSDNYWLQLQGETDLDGAQDNYPFGPSQAIRTYLIDPVLDDNNNPTGDWAALPSDIISNGHPLEQSNSISSKGGINEFSLSVAGNYDDKLFIGASLNIPSINYDRSQTFRETNTQDKNSVLNYFDVDNSLHTNGVGINGKLGLIYSPQPALRLGAAFHTPTVYTLHDTYSTRVTTSTTDQGLLTSSTQDITDGYPGEYDYNLTTPWHALASVSYLFNDGVDAPVHGFITADYEYVNYAAAKYRFNRDDGGSGLGGATAKDQADALNRSIKDMYKGASNLRLGGEVKFNVMAVRAGVAWYGSPYQDSNVKGDQLLYSGGLGYRNGGFFADLTYVYNREKDEDQPYYVTANDAGIPSPQPAALTSGGSNIILTIGFKL